MTEKKKEGCHVTLTNLFFMSEISILWLSLQHTNGIL